MSEDPTRHMSNEEKQRLSERNAARDAEQERRARIIAATDQRSHVTQGEDSKCREMVEELRAHDPDAGDGSGERQTDWDIGFLDDVANFELLYSINQAKKIRQIWSRIFNG